MPEYNITSFKKIHKQNTTIQKYITICINPLSLVQQQKIPREYNKATKMKNAKIQKNKTYTDNATILQTNKTNVYKNIYKIQHIQKSTQNTNIYKNQKTNAQIQQIHNIPNNTTKVQNLQKNYRK